MDTPPPDVESDPRFPSGPWTGFFLQPPSPGRHMMELCLVFRQGSMAGEGRDWVGRFIIRGRYDLGNGRCRWTKRYIGKHDVFYQGYNEGKGIWGLWEITSEGFGTLHGGFHIWPEGMEDPTQLHLHAEAESPLQNEPVNEEAEEFVGAAEGR